MPMRTECKNYESRTYANGEVVRKCRVDLAPEAPWRCPAECAGFERRMFDAGWQVGSLSEPTCQPASNIRRSKPTQFSGQRHGASGARSTRHFRTTSPLAYVRLS